MDRHVTNVKVPHFLVGTIVGPFHCPFIVIPKGGGEVNVRHVEVREKVAEELGNPGTFVSRFDFRFTGAPANTGFTDASANKNYHISIMHHRIVII